MKWYNEDRRKMINLESVDGYVYIPAENYLTQYPTGNDAEDFKLNGNRLELIISGTPYVFRSNDATEIYGLLLESCTKQILQG